MEFEFDKEMDALLRQSAQGETAFAANTSQSAIRSSHLDADEISLFAENALPEKTKLSYTAHFADCNRCRKILSNVISLNSETAEKAVHAPEIAKITNIAPWYRRLFAVPNLAYAMGALLLVFVGLIALTFLQNAPKTAEVSQVREAPVNMPGASSDGETRTIESGAPPSNSATTVSNAATMNSAQTSRSNSSSMPNRAMSNASSVSAMAANKQNAANREPAKTENQPENELAFAPRNKAESPANSANVEEKKKQKSDDEVARAPENDSAQSDAASLRNTTPTIGATRSATDRPQAKNVRKSSAENSETKQIGGKTFGRKNGVWYDSIYNGQSTTNIARASEDFKKLDTGLHSIADSLSGTIVVLWKGKAYRIQ